MATATELRNELFELAQERELRSIGHPSEIAYWSSVMDEYERVVDAVVVSTVRRVSTVGRPTIRTRTMKPLLLTDRRLFIGMTWQLERQSVTSVEQCPRGHHKVTTRTGFHWEFLAFHGFVPLSHLRSRRAREFFDRLELPVP